jgi:rfaE bifunctional protein nucleotidyltransferase chain/domain
MRPPAETRIYQNAQLLAKQVRTWQNAGEEVVFTNGVFDILHAGHIRYLEDAAQLGDRLVIAVNDDASVKRLKGETRPINELHSRLYLLASLSCVDGVISFSEDTPLEVIMLVRPDILVKGGDYSPETIVGAEEMLEWGGRVEVIPFVEGFSTTRLENTILNRHRGK